MSNIFKNNEAIVHQSNKGETTVFPKNSIWYKIGFDTNMTTFRSRYNDEVIFYENDVTELAINGKLPENFVTEFNKIAYAEGAPKIEYDILAVYNVTSTTSATSLSYETALTANIEAMYIDDEQVAIGNAATFDSTGEHTVKYKLINNTSIGSNAFQNCSGLTEIVIPNSVTNIGIFAFSNCTRLTSINIPDSVTSISTKAFSNCSSLSNIAVSELNEVYDSRDNCNAIIKTSTNELVLGCKNTIIPNTVTSIGEAAFYGCRSLISIEIPNSVTSIGNEAFYNCSNLTSATLGNSVTSIGNTAFVYCSSLTEIVIPDSVTSIGSQVFWFCSSLTEITFNAITAPTIGNSAFGSISSTGTLYYPCGSDYSTIISNLPSTWSSECFGEKPEIDYTFSTTYDVKNVNSPATLYSTYKTYFQDNIEKMYLNDEEIPISSTYQFPEIGEYEVKYKLKNTSLPDFAFYQTRTVYTIDLKDVTEIGLSCFENSFLKGELILGENIERIGANAFEQTDITDVTIIPTFISCYNSRFTNCSKLSSVTSNEQFIWSSDFEGCGKLVNTNFPNLEEIGQKAFSRCVSLTSFTVPSSVEIISHKAFENCSGLTEITFEMPTLAGVELGTDIFKDCTQHINVTYPCSADYEVLLNHIANYTTNCVQDQYDIKAVYQVLTPNEEIVLFNEGEINFIPYLEKMYVDNVEIDLSTLIKVNQSYQIGNRLVFSEVGEHTVKYKLVDYCHFIENAAFLNITSLVSVNLAKDFVSIGYNAFEQCVNLHTVKLPNSVEYIYNGAFYSCTSLTSVTLGEYVKEIGWNAFERCQSMNYIEFKGTTAPIITPNSFTDVGANGTIVHPCGYNYNAIRAALPNWYCECDLFEITDFDVLAAFDIDAASAGVETPIAFELTNISQIYVNEVPVGVVSAYTFNSAGQYIVKYKLVDRTTIKTVSGGSTFNGTLTSMFCSATTMMSNVTVKTACTKMTGVAVMEGVSFIGNASFAGCTGLREVILPSSLLSIGQNAFIGCSGLTSITCNALTAPTISNTTFRNVAKNGTLFVPANTNYSSWLATENYYLGLYTWTSGIIPEVIDPTDYDILTVINVEDTTVPTQISADEITTEWFTTTPFTAYTRMMYVDDINVTPTSTYQFSEAGTHTVKYKLYDNKSVPLASFSGVTSLINVEIGNTFTEIVHNAFEATTNLEYIYIPDSVVSIGNGAFYASGIEVAVIGENVDTFGNNAMQNCPNLTTIIFKSDDLPSYQPDTFIDNPLLGEIVYKCSSINASRFESFGSQLNATVNCATDEELEEIA